MKADFGHLSHQGNEFGFCSSSNGKSLKKTEQESEVFKIILDTMWKGDFAVWVSEQESLRSEVFCYWVFPPQLSAHLLPYSSIHCSPPYSTHTTLPDVGY